MKNTNITLHTTQKKEYVLTGILSLPLHLRLGRRPLAVL